jgi:hypothetical protein
VVLATPVSSIPQVIEHGRNGLLLEGVEPRHVVPPLASLLAAPGEWRRLSEAAQADAHRFTYERYVEELDALLALEASRGSP